MPTIGYLIRTDLKKHLGDAPDESRTCFVLPPPEFNLSYSVAAEKAFDLVVQALHEQTRSQVIEEASHRMVFVEDLRPLRNSLLLEKDGWKCFSVKA
jgi:hypothetical protein